MGKISILFFLWWVGIAGAFGQRLILPDSVLLSGVVINTEDDQPLTDVTCRYQGKITLTDLAGQFTLQAERGDTVLFTYVGFKTFRLIVPDSLTEKEYMVGVFMSPDTIRLGEALILQRFGNSLRRDIVTARNNFSGVLKQAYSPVDRMDAEMNQKMMLEDYARSVEMRGHVDVRAGVGTQSYEALRRLKRSKKWQDQPQILHYEEVDLLKKLYYLEKKENKQN